VPKTVYEVVEKVYDFENGKWKYRKLEHPMEKATFVCSECDNEWYDYLR